MIQVGEEVDGVAIVRCAADVRSADQTGKEGDVLYKETLCPLKYLQEVWQQPQAGRVTEKYYDCLQCTEQCRHLTIVATTNNNNNNNNVTLLKTVKTELTPKSSVRNRRVGNPIGSSTIKETNKTLSRLDETRALKSQRNIYLTRPLKNQPLPLIQAKKRSSLARPLRVRELFSPPRKPMCPNYALQMPQKRETNEFPYANEHEETTWPIRLRLEPQPMLELTLPHTKEKRRKKKMWSKNQLQQQRRHVFQYVQRLRNNVSEFWNWMDWHLTDCLSDGMDPSFFDRISFSDHSVFMDDVACMM